MPKVKELIMKLAEDYDPEEEIAYTLWSKIDVVEEAKSYGDELTQDEIDEVVMNLHEHYDPYNGMTWEGLRCEINDVISNRG